MSKNKEINLLSMGNENETVVEAQRGNMKAFEHLVTLYEGYVYNLCYNVFYNSLDAQDCTQEIFVKIYKNINSFKFNSQFKTWVYKIAINTCIDEYNRKKKRIFDIVDPEDMPTYEVPDKKGKTPEELIIEEELRGDIKNIIKSLPLKYRVVIVLRDMQGLTYEEISETLKVNINTVKVRVNRGRLQIKEKYLKLEKKRKRNQYKDFSFKNEELVKGGK